MVRQIGVPHNEDVETRLTDTSIKAFNEKRSHPVDRNIQEAHPRNRLADDMVVGDAREYRRSAFVERKHLY